MGCEGRCDRCYQGWLLQGTWQGCAPSGSLPRPRKDVLQDCLEAHHSCRWRLRACRMSMRLCEPTAIRSPWVDWQQTKLLSKQVVHTICRHITLICQLALRLPICNP